MRQTVVHVCKVSGVAGAEKHLLCLLPGLAARGLDIRLLVLGSEGETRGFRDDLTATGVASHRVSMRAPLDPLAVVALARHFRRLQPALVHTHLIHADLLGQAAARWARVAHRVSSRHNPDPFRRGAMVRGLGGLLLRGIDRVIAISGAVARFASAVEGVDPATIRTVPYGLDATPECRAGRQATRSALGIGDGVPLVGLVGRAVRQKGIDVLLDAFPGVLEEHPAARLVIVGDGPLRAALERQARARQLVEAVLFAGWVDRAAAWMAALDLVVIPSRWEGFGMVALEAMAAARPVVASRVDGLEEIVVDGATGLLVPPQDPASLANAVSRLLADPGRAASLGEAGLRRLQSEYPVSRMVEATASVYAELLGDELRE